MGYTGIFSRIQEYMRYRKYRGIFKSTRIHEIWEIQGYFQETRIHEIWEIQGYLQKYKNTWDIGNTGVVSRIQCTVHPCTYLQFSFAYNGPTNQNNLLWLGGSKLHRNCDFFPVLSRALKLNKNMNWNIKISYVVKLTETTEKVLQYRSNFLLSIFLYIDLSFLFH